MNKTKILMTGLIMTMAAGQLGATNLAATQVLVTHDNESTLREVFDRGTGSVGKINLPSVKAQPALGGIQNYQPLASAQPELTKKSAKPSAPAKARRNLRDDTSGALSTGGIVAIGIGMLLIGIGFGGTIGMALIMLGLGLAIMTLVRSRE